MKRKDAILQAAAMLFSRKGFRDTSMAEVAKITGVAGGTIFYHYKNKEELFLAILSELRTDISDSFDRFLERSHPPSGLDATLGLVDWYLHLAGEMEDRFLLLQHYFPYRLSIDNPELREQIEALFDHIIRIFETTIRQGQEDGSIRTVPAQKAALLIFSLVDGVVRLHNFQLYDGGALYEELIAACRRVLESAPQDQED